MTDDKQISWISVEERLPELGKQVWVYGELDPVFQGPLVAGMPEKSAWITKRGRKSSFTDGNGFIRLQQYGHLAISHWFPIPLLNGKEIFETLPVE